MNNSNCSQSNASDKMLFVTVYSCVVIIGVPTNSLAVLSLYQARHAVRTVPVYLVNLAVADLVYGCTLPLWIIYFMKEHQWELGRAACQLSGFLFFINMYASVYFVCCIAVDRYLAIVHPVRWRNIHTAKGAIAISIFGWVFLGVSQMPVFMSDLTKGQLCIDYYLITKSDAIRIFIMVFLGFVIPTLILTYSYLTSLKALKRTVSDVGETLCIRYLLGIALLLYLLCFGPFNLMLLFFAVNALVNGLCCLTRSPFFMCYRVTVALTSCSCFIDPLLYIFTCKEVKNRLKLNAIYRCLEWDWFKR
ncbi:GPR4 protein, partial [Polypterus senegalus]|nr:GPR4 protein [Polypterus senegalus]